MRTYFKKTLSALLSLVILFTTSVPGVFAAVNYTYDVSGNMTSDGTKCYEYNQANQLSKVKTCSGTTIAEYLYDHEGKRIVTKEYENGVLKQTIYSPNKEYEVKKLSNGITESNSYYTVNNEVVAQKKGTEVSYFHNDHLGSTSTLSNQGGTLVENTSYSPYGEVSAGGTKSKYQFTGQEKDATGLNYYGARYYDPHIARFTQPDSVLPNVYDPQQLNRYAYTRNNPLKYTDPSGNFVFIPVLLAAWAVTETAMDFYSFGNSLGNFVGNQSSENRLNLMSDTLSMMDIGGIGEMAAKTLNHYGTSSDARQQLMSGDLVGTAGAVGNIAVGTLTTRAVSKGIANVANNTLKNLPYQNSRPKLLKGQREEIWNNAIETSTGRVRDPRSGRFMSSKQAWDVGHSDLAEYWFLNDLHKAGKISTEEFKTWNRDVLNLRPELPKFNRGATKAPK
jgi:RHS repeat-associated protein